MPKAIAELSYEVGERVITRYGWGEIIRIREETYPRDITDEVTYACVVKLDVPSRLGQAVVSERNPRKSYQYAIITRFWNIGEPKTEEHQMREFLTKDEALEDFERPVASSGQGCLMIFVDYQGGTSRTRLLTADGEAVRFP